MGPTHGVTPRSIVVVFVKPFALGWFDVHEFKSGGGEVKSEELTSAAAARV